MGVYIQLYPGSILWWCIWWWKSVRRDLGSLGFECKCSSGSLCPHCQGWKHSKLQTWKIIPEAFIAMLWTSSEIRKWNGCSIHFNLSNFNYDVDNLPSSTTPRSRSPFVRALLPGVASSITISRRCRTPEFRKQQMHILGTLQGSTFTRLPTPASAKC